MTDRPADEKWEDFEEENPESKKNDDEYYFCHIIIPSKDYNKSKDFFEGVFGWKVMEIPGMDILDVMPMSHKGPGAELNSDEDVVIPAIYTSDIEKTLENITKFGGKVLKSKTPVSDKGDLGFYALFLDTQGNKFALYQD